MPSEGSAESETIMSELTGYAICKECTAGTLNNVLNPQFTVDESGDGSLYVVCASCGSTHIDGELSWEPGFDE